MHTINKNLSTEYIAGLFDGEGNINISDATNGISNKKYKSIKVAIIGSHRPMIESIFYTMNIGSFSTQKRQALYRTPRYNYTTNILNVNENVRLCKQCWRWMLTSKRECKDFLQKIYPYLIEKKEQVRVCLEFLDGKMDGDTALKLCKEYKKFNFPSDNFKTIRLSDGLLRGRDNPACKLSNEQVIKIYIKFHKENISAHQLAKDFDVSANTTERIVNGKIWKHLTSKIQL